MASYDRILVHYSEIGTKKGNRPAFESRLRDNADRALEGTGVEKLRRESGRLTAAIGPDTDLEAVFTRLARVPGIAWFAPARTLPPDMVEISKAVVEMAVAHPPSTFRVDTRRMHKPFPLDSLAVNREVGAAVVEATGRKVSLANADYRYGVHILKSRAYVFWDRREGPGGLPVGSQGSLVALLSGGIDSPVAAHRMMLRGCRIHLVHFLNRSVETNRVKEKIDGLATVLARWQGEIDLTVVPFEDLQREIVMVVPAKFRMIVYRRAMLRIAERLREEVRALGLVTGDSVGQVASQTLENLRAVHAAVDWPIYAPLTGMSKQEIVNQAKSIGTFEISSLPHEDCCSFLVAKHPVTKARLDEVEALEVFDVAAETESAFAGRETTRFSAGDSD